MSEASGTTRPETTQPGAAAGPPKGQAAGSPGRGRPRSEAVRLAVLAAVAEVLREVGYDRLTIDGIATRAGVGRRTVYRWWKSKSAIVAEAVLAGVISIGDERPPALGSPRENIIASLRAFNAALSDPGTAGVVRALAAAAADDEAVSDLLYERISRPSAVWLAEQVGELGLEHPQAAADALNGALLYRVLARIPTGDGYVRELAATVLGAARD